MNILFLTIGSIESVKAHALYPDLIRELASNGHTVHVVSALEKRHNESTRLVKTDGIYDLKVKIGNLTKCGIIEKGISTLMITRKYKAAIKKYFPDVRFDLVLYSTPPITLAGVVEYIKHRDNAKTYLLLKDIFPQNAVDIGMLRKSGLKGIIYKYFRRKEKMLYRLSDRIGCMSQANVDYILEHNPEVPADIVEVCPNSIEVLDFSPTDAERLAMREKYGLPADKKIFVYGGNLGKPQGIPFIIECLKASVNVDAFFLIIGDGTEFGKLKEYIENEKPSNVMLLKRIPKDDYDRMIHACDIGLIFLDHRFTIPNFPSRLLSYMQARLPVLACTDVNTDIGSVITEGRFGWWCESNDANGFADMVEKIINSNTEEFEKNSWDYLNSNYDIEKAYMTIVKPEDKYSSESFAIAGR